MSNFLQFLQNKPRQDQIRKKPSTSAQEQINFSLSFPLFQELLKLKIQLNTELLVNELLIEGYGNTFMNQKTTVMSDLFSKPKSTQTKASQTQIEQKEAIKKYESLSLSRAKQEIKRKKKVGNLSGDEYLPEQEPKRESNNEANSTIRVPSAIGHQILRFIKKNKDIVKRILDSLGIEHKKFFMIAKYYRQKGGTMLELKSIWLEETNKYAKAFRIISQFYLRKVKIPITFNSSVQNYHKHMKYMRKARVILRNIQYL